MGTWSIGLWIVVAIVLVLLFGTKRLKNLGGDLGGAMRDFRKAFKEGGQDSANDAEAPRLQADPPEQAKASAEQKEKAS